ncbi:MAG: Histidine kinase [Candidatus Peregrinibacteria bacterium GW2011_GWC2_39_14]|nr:MAG: Histidine kinase [Candidatus Peregrinibacteria bacterium GW2011_GWC2_39_14]
MGLYRVRKIIELHNGRVWAESAGKNKGAKIIVEFPVFKGDIKAYLDKGKTETPKKMF